MPASSRRLFALDHNFPVPVVRALAPFMPEAELVPISQCAHERCVLGGIEGVCRCSPAWCAVVLEQADRNMAATSQAMKSLSRPRVSVTARWM
jgi:hypothetical protein